MKLRIKTNTEDNSFQGSSVFPLLDGQFFDVDDKGPYLDLGDATDTTAAQEQALDTNPDVDSYEIEK